MNVERVNGERASCPSMPCFTEVGVCEQLAVLVDVGVVRYGGGLNKEQDDYCLVYPNNDCCLNVRLKLIDYAEKF